MFGGLVSVLICLCLRLAHADPTDAEQQMRKNLLTFDCSKVKDGHYEHPKFPCQRLFVSCGGGVTYVTECPAPTLRFDNTSGNCLQSANIESCGGSSTVPPTTPARTIPPIDCFDLGDGKHANPDKRCDDIFYVCLSGVVFKFDCSTGTKFSSYHGTCEFPDKVPDCGGTPDKTSSTTSTEETTATSPDQTFNCNRKSIGSHADPSEACSNVFFVCAGAQYGSRQVCPAGTYFDAKKELCNFFGQVPACADEVQPTTTPQQQPSGPTTPAVDFDCTGKELGNYPDDKANCSRRFFTCSLSGPLERQCAFSSVAITYYDADLDRCLLFDDVPECSGIPRNKTESTTTVVQATTSTEGLSFDCTQLLDGNYPIPDAFCVNEFYQCANGRAFKLICSTTFLRYNHFKDSCMIPSQVPGCQEYRNVACRDRSNGFYPVPTECEKFIFCIDQFVFFLYCPVGLVFDEARRRCERPNVAQQPCGLAEPPVPFTCPADEDGFFPSMDCGRYYSCTDGQRKELRCDSGKAFDSSLMECQPAVKVQGCMPPMELDLMDFCKARNRDGLYPFPGNDCHRSVVCLSDTPFVFQCVDDEPDFDPITLSCVKEVKGCD